MDDTGVQIHVIQKAYNQLKKLGWNDVIYAPKDGTIFEVIQAGSTGIFDCSYSGKWPDGSFDVYDGGDTYPTTGAGLMLFRPKASHLKPVVR